MDTFDLLGEFKQKVSIAIGAAAEGFAYSAFSESYERINSAYDEYQNESADSSNEKLNRLVVTLLESTKFENYQSALLENSGEIADLIISMYIETVNNIFDGKSFANLKSNYQLNADQRAIQRSKICSIIVANFGAASDIREIQTQRAWLQSNHSAIFAAISKGLDLGIVARNFGAGALAFVSPWVGVPALVANLVGQIDKENATEERVQFWNEKFKEFEVSINKLRTKVDDFSKKVKLYAIDKSTEVNGDAIIAICNDLKNSGHDLEYFNDFVNASISELDSYIISNSQGD